MAEYDDITARHYAAWRPPLHGPILAKAFAEGENFIKGLDVGCGVGHSSHALAKYCAQVTGLEPSEEMVELAVGTDQVRFLQQMESITLGVPDRGYDLFTFAGSLHYQEPDQVIEGMSLLASVGATVVVYDFDVQLEEVASWLLGGPLPGGDYDHRKNFSGVANAALKEVMHHEERLYFSVSAEELAHLLLSVESWRMACFSDESHATLTQRLLPHFSRERGLLQADTYLTRYAF